MKYCNIYFYLTEELLSPGVWFRLKEIKNIKIQQGDTLATTLPIKISLCTIKSLYYVVKATSR